jgi:hypothetical protein
MIDYVWYAPTRVIYGKGRTDQVGERCARYGFKKVLLVWGGGSVERTGTLGRVRTSLEEADVSYIEFPGAQPNPDVAPVRKGIELARREQIDLVLAVGGGSSIDTAKGIAVGVPYEGDVWDFFCKKAHPAEALPVATVLTIPGTGSETSRNIVLSNAETCEKIGIAPEVTRPCFSILDPELCVTIPAHVAAPGIYDMFSHTEERYMSETTHADTTYGVAEAVLRSIVANGRALMKDPTNVDVWGDLMVAGDLAHNSVTGFGIKTDWTNHALEEPVSGIYPQLAHGAGLAITTHCWMRYVYKKHLDVFVRFAVNVMGISGDLADRERVALTGIEALERWTRELGLPLTWAEVGLEDADFETIAKRVCSYHSSGTVGSLEKLEWQQVLDIYRMGL